MRDELGYIPPPQAARFVGRATRTLADWRIDRKGPRYFRVNGRVLYAVADLIQWVEGRAPTSPARKSQEPNQRRGFARRGAHKRWEARLARFSESPPESPSAGRWE